jgi:AcrR family transcriptional regulator
MTSPKERRQARTREAILDAARTIIAEKGADALSMRAIAQRIDYSPAGLYEYFDGKDGIIRAVCQDGSQQLFQLMDQVEKEQPPADYLQAIGHAYIRFAIDKPDHFLLMFTNRSPIQSEEEAEQSEEGSAFGLLVSAIRRGVEMGVFRPRPNFDVLTIAYAAWATVHGLAMLRATHLQGYPMDFAVGEWETLSNFTRGLTAMD